MPDIKDMEGPVKFKKGVELYFDPKKDMFYDPKKKKYVSEKDILKLEDVDFDELETIEEGVYDPSIFKAIFMAGGPGSGKSYVSNKVTAGLGMKVVNSDDIFEIFLKKAGMTTTAKDIFSDKGQEIRGNAKSVTSKRMKLYLEGRLGLLIDGTGKDYNNIKKKADRLRDLGYDTYMVFVNTSLEIAQERNAARSRKLDPKEVEKMWRAVQENIGLFQKYFGARNMIIVDNNAADEKYLTEVYKQVKKLIKKPPQNRIARNWISKALDDKVRKEEVELEEGRDEEYEKFFQSALKKFGVSSPSELKGDKKKEFFDYVDKNWEGENEEDEEETVEENCHSKHKKIKEDEEFKPHMMYDPKTGKAYKAEKPEDHERMKKLGYTHEKPKKIEELSLEEAIEEAKEWKVGAPVFIVISYHTNGKHSTTVLRTKEKAIKFAKDEEYHEDDVKGTAVLDMKVGKFIDKKTGKHIKEDVELSEKMQKYVDACGKDFTTYSLKEGKKDYEIYHKTFTSAVQEVEKFAEKNGYEIDSDEMFNKVGTGPKKPSVGKTNEYHLTLMKNGKEDRKKLHFQVYGLKSQYELNMYIS